MTLQKTPSSQASALERAIFENIQSEGTEIWKVRGSVWPKAAEPRQHLEELGLLVSGTTQKLVRWLPALLIFSVTLLGVAKIIVGTSRHKPVAFLVILTIASAIIAIVFLSKRALRSRYGDWVLDQHRRENAALEQTVRRQPERLAEADFCFALGLFGMGVLAGGPLNALHTGILKQAAGGTGSGCGGSTCGGGGGCGGGGCGGGGCGGCGG
jgi:uncharacterized protein (TIGR04222 family)